MTHFSMMHSAVKNRTVNSTAAKSSAMKAERDERIYPTAGPGRHFPIAETFPFQGKHLLLVCEEQLDRSILKVALESSGHQVLEAAGMNEGLRRCANFPHRPQAAVIVTDLNGGAWACLDILRTALDGLPLMAMSPDEVAWLVDGVEAKGGKALGPWLERVNAVLEEGQTGAISALNLV